MTLDAISLIYIKKRVSPETELCGTPDVTGDHLDFSAIDKNTLLKS